MTGPTDGILRGNPPVMTYDPKGNAVVNPREAETDLNAAEISRRNADARQAESERRDAAATPATKRGAKASARKSGKRKGR